MPRRILLALLLSAATLSSAGAATKDTPAKVGPPAPPAGKEADPTAPTKNAGEGIDDATQYRHCIALARQKPDDGWEEALAWSSLGGGEPARHCGAIALIGLRQYEEGASRLEGLAAISHADAKLRAGMLAQAGQAWLLAKNPERANAAQTAALKLVPGAPDLLVDRAQSFAEAKNYREALTDLDQALVAAPRPFRRLDLPCRRQTFPRRPQGRRGRYRPGIESRSFLSGRLAGGWDSQTSGQRRRRRPAILDEGSGNRPQLGRRRYGQAQHRTSGRQGSLMVIVRA